MKRLSVAAVAVVITRLALAQEAINPYFRDVQPQVGLEGGLTQYERDVAKFSAAREARSLKLLSASKLLEPRPRDVTMVRYAFFFGGPTLDDDLARFYLYFAVHYPAALQPVAVDMSLALAACQPKAAACDTVNGAAVAYGVIGRWYTPLIEQAIKELSRRYGQLTFPGLLLGPYEHVDRWRTKTTTARELCTSYRLDGRIDCVEKRSGDVTVINGQGLTTEIRLPAARSEELIAGYTEFVKGTPGFRDENFAYFRVTDIQPQDRAAAAVEDATAASVVKFEADGITTHCDGAAPLDAHLADADGLARHVAAYRNTVFGATAMGGTPSYPVIVFYDRFFADETRHANVALTDAELRHPDFDAAAPAAGTRFRPCVAYNADAGTHGMYVTGLLAARRNGFGIVGLLPDYDRDRLRLLDIRNDADLVKLLPRAARSDPAERTVVVNLSIALTSVSDSQVQRIAETVSAANDRALFITAAGQQGQTGVEVSDKSRTLLASLGNLPNVITVAALDDIEGAQQPRLWQATNFGGVVSVAAPGYGILSTDLVPDNDGGMAFGYSVRDGTSAATVFVTAVAALILARQPDLAPAQVKKKILASVGEVEGGHDHARYLYAGDGVGGSSAKGPIAAGYLQLPPSDGERQYAVKLRNQPLRRGRLRFNSQLSEMILFADAAGGTSVERKCAVGSLYRLTRRDDNQFSMFCSTKTVAPERLLFYDRMFLLPDEGVGMFCLYHNNTCMWLQDAQTGAEIPINLEEVEDLRYSF